MICNKENLIEKSVNQNISMLELSWDHCIVNSTGSFFILVLFMCNIILCSVLLVQIMTWTYAGPDSSQSDSRPNRKSISRSVDNIICSDRTLGSSQGIWILCTHLFLFYTVGQNQAFLNLCSFSQSSHSDRLHKLRWSPCGQEKGRVVSHGV